MLALMPRCTDCVLCGKPIQGTGRIDRIYCSASCRTLAWRARAGHCFEEGRKPKLPPQPGDFIARKALPLLAVRMRAELAAAKQRIAELEERLTDQRGGSAPVSQKFAVGVVAAIGTIGIVAAFRRRRRRQQAKSECAHNEAEAARQKNQAEMNAERPPAAHRKVGLRAQITALTVRAEQAEAREQAAVASISTLKQAVEALRHELDQNENNVRKMHFDLAALQNALAEAYQHRSRQSDALLKESQQRQHLQRQLTEARRHFRVQEQELEATDAMFTEESQQREHLQLQLTTIQRQLGSERQAWKNARALLTRHAQEDQSRLVADNRQLRHLLAAQKSRTQVTAGTIAGRQHEAENKEHRSLERIDDLERKRLPDSERKMLSGSKEPKQIPDEKPQNQLPAVSGLSVKGSLPALGVWKNAAVGARLIDRASQSLPKKGVGASFKDTSLPNRKLLPPKRD